MSEQNLMESTDHGTTGVVPPRSSATAAREANHSSASPEPRCWSS